MTTIESWPHLWAFPVLKWTVLAVVGLGIGRLLSKRDPRLWHNLLVGAIISLPLSILAVWLGLFDHLYALVDVEYVTSPVRGFPRRFQSGWTPPLIVEEDVDLRLWSAAALLVWAGGIAILAARFTDSWLRVRKMLNDSELASKGLNELAQSLLPATKVEVRVSVLAPVPFVMGVRKPVIVLPKEEADSDLVVRHEAAHIRSADVLSGFGVLFVGLVFWPHPLVWAGQRSATLARELDCDDYAASSGDRLRYALLLRRYAIASGPTVQSFGGIGVKERVQRILHYRGPVKESRGRLVIPDLASTIIFGLTAFHFPRGPLPVVFNNDASLTDATVAIEEALGRKYPASFQEVRQVRVIASFSGDLPSDLGELVEALGATDVSDSRDPTWVCEHEALAGESFVTFFLPPETLEYDALLRAEQAGLKVCDIWKDPNLALVLGIPRTLLPQATQALVRTGVVVRAGSRDAADSLGGRPPAFRTLKSLSGIDVPMPKGWLHFDEWGGGIAISTPGDRVSVWLGEELALLEETGSPREREFIELIQLAEEHLPIEAFTHPGFMGPVSDGVVVNDTLAYLRYRALDTKGTRLIAAGSPMYLEAVALDLELLIRDFRRLSGEDPLLRVTKRSPREFKLTPPRFRQSQPRNPVEMHALGDDLIHWATDVGAKSTRGMSLMLEAANAGLSVAAFDAWEHEGYRLNGRPKAAAHDPLEHSLLLALKLGDPSALLALDRASKTDAYCQAFPELARHIPTEETVLANQQHPSLAEHPGVFTSVDNLGRRVPSMERLKARREEALKLLRSGRLTAVCAE